MGKEVTHRIRPLSIKPSSQAHATKLARAKDDPPGGVAVKPHEPNDIVNEFPCDFFTFPTPESRHFGWVEEFRDKDRCIECPCFRRCEGGGVQPQSDSVTHGCTMPNFVPLAPAWSHPKAKADIWVIQIQSLNCSSGRVPPGRQFDPMSVGGRIARDRKALLKVPCDQPPVTFVESEKATWGEQKTLPSLRCFPECVDDLGAKQQ